MESIIEREVNTLTNSIIEDDCEETEREQLKSIFRKIFQELVNDPGFISLTKPTTDPIDRVTLDDIYKLIQSDNFTNGFNATTKASVTAKKKLVLVLKKKN